MSESVLSNPMPPTQIQRQLLTAFLSALCYGGWAWFVNADADTRVVSTLVQGTGSFVAGYFVSALVESTFRRLSRPWRLPVAAIVPYWLVLLAFAGAHMLVGTANVLATLLPNLIIGTLFFLVYCYGLEKNS